MDKNVTVVEPLMAVELSVHDEDVTGGFTLEDGVELSDVQIGFVDGLVLPATVENGMKDVRRDTVVPDSPIHGFKDEDAVLVDLSNNGRSK